MRAPRGVRGAGLPPGGRLQNISRTHPYNGAKRCARCAPIQVIVVRPFLRRFEVVVDGWMALGPVAPSLVGTLFGAPHGVDSDGVLFLVLGAAATALRAPRGRRSARPAPRRRRLAPRRSRQAPPPPAPPATRREFLTLAAGLLASTVVPTSAFALPSPSTRGPADNSEVRAALRAALEANIVKTKAPAVLRLVFHDAGIYRVATGDGGLNGSVQYELGRPESFGLKRGLGPVKAVRDALRDGPADGLSLADVIGAPRARTPWNWTGGPKIEYRLGRVDTTVADPENRMPSESLDGDETRAHPAASGFDVGEMVVPRARTPRGADSASRTASITSTTRRC